MGTIMSPKPPRIYSIEIDNIKKFGLLKGKLAAFFASIRTSFRTAECGTRKKWILGFRRSPPLPPAAAC